MHTASPGPTQNLQNALRIWQLANESPERKADGDQNHGCYGEFEERIDHHPGVSPDDRVAEAIDLVQLKREGDGRWLLKTQYPGRMPVELNEGKGRPSRWNTLRALRVLDWYSTRD